MCRADSLEDDGPLALKRSMDVPHLVAALGAGRFAYGVGQWLDAASGAPA